MEVPNIVQEAVIKTTPKKRKYKKLKWSSEEALEIAKRSKRQRKKESESESEVAQSCPTLSDPMDCSLPGSPVHGIFQARVLEWVAIAFSQGRRKDIPI